MGSGRWPALNVFFVLSRVSQIFDFRRRGVSITDSYLCQEVHAQAPTLVLSALD